MRQHPLPRSRRSSEAVWAICRDGICHGNLPRLERREQRAARETHSTHFQRGSRPNFQPHVRLYSCNDLTSHFDDSSVAKEFLPNKNPCFSKTSLRIKKFIISEANSDRALAFRNIRRNMLMPL